MGELAVAAIDRAPLLGHGQDRLDLPRQQAMHRMPARSPIHEGADIAESGSPAVHPVVRDVPEPARPGVVEPVGNGLIDGLEDQLLGFGGDPRRERPDQSQPAFPRTTASSVACALTA